jgi:hypothetical protein
VTSNAFVWPKMIGGVAVPAQKDPAPYQRAPDWEALPEVEYVEDCVRWCTVDAKPKAPKKQKERVRSHRQYTDRERIMIAAMIDGGLTYAALSRLLHMCPS